jgi:hypothetical protein
MVQWFKGSKVQRFNGLLFNIYCLMFNVGIAAPN